MQVGHVSVRMLAPALASIYAAKKNAEIAPGVGRATDMQIVLKDAIFPVWDSVTPELERLYAKYSAEVSAIGEGLVHELNEFVGRPNPGQAKAHERPFEADGKASEADAGASADTSETARENENRTTEGGSGGPSPVG